MTDTSFRGIMKATIKKAAKKIASDTGAELIEQASDFFSPLLDAQVEKFEEQVTKLLE